MIAARWMQGQFSLTKPAWVGAIVAGMGGLSKATWKLIVVTTGSNITVLNNALFPLLGAGFVLLTTSLICGLLKKNGLIWPVALAIIAAFYVWSWTKIGDPDPRAWTLVLLFMTAGFSTLFSLCLTGIGLARRKISAAVLIFASIAGSFYLAKLAQIPEQTLALQWKEELVNTASQGIFLIGILLLAQSVFRKPDPT